MEQLLLDTLARHGLASGSGGDWTEDRTPVVIQSFSSASLRIIRDELDCRLPLVLLVSEQGLLTPGEATRGRGSLSPASLKRVADFVEGFGPAKELVTEYPESVQWAQAAGLKVAPWTFRAEDSGAFGNVTEEMAYFLYDLGVDALFTNNPDLFPR